MALETILAENDFTTSFYGLEYWHFDLNTLSSFTMSMIYVLKRYI